MKDINLQSHTAVAGMQALCSKEEQGDIKNPQHVDDEKVTPLEQTSTDHMLWTCTLVWLKMGAGLLCLITATIAGLLIGWAAGWILYYLLHLLHILGDDFPSNIVVKSTAFAQMGLAVLACFAGGWFVGSRDRRPLGLVLALNATFLGALMAAWVVVLAVGGLALALNYIGMGACFASHWLLFLSDSSCDSHTLVNAGSGFWLIFADINAVFYGLLCGVVLGLSCYYKICGGDLSFADYYKIPPELRIELPPA